MIVLVYRYRIIHRLQIELFGKGRHMNLDELCTSIVAKVNDWWRLKMVDFMLHRWSMTSLLEHCLKLHPTLLVRYCCIIIELQIKARAYSIFIPFLIMANLRAQTEIRLRTFTYIRCCRGNWPKSSLETSCPNP